MVLSFVMFVISMVSFFLSPPNLSKLGKKLLGCIKKEINNFEIDDYDKLVLIKSSKELNKKEHLVFKNFNSRCKSLDLRVGLYSYFGENDCCYDYFLFTSLSDKDKFYISKELKKIYQSLKNGKGKQDLAYEKLNNIFDSSV